eukprot:4359355-Pleurochrysis_carterae.AAC.1
MYESPTWSAYCLRIAYPLQRDWRSETSRVAHGDGDAADVVAEGGEGLEKVDLPAVVGDVEFAEKLEHLGARERWLDVGDAQRRLQLLQDHEERVRWDGEGALGVEHEPDLAKLLDRLDRDRLVLGADVGEVVDDHADEEAVEDDEALRSEFTL